MNIFEQIIFIGYTSLNPILILILLISILGVCGELYLQILIINPTLKPILPPSLVLGMTGVLQALMVPLIVQHTLPFHQQLIWTYVALFFAVIIHIDSVNLTDHGKTQKSYKILTKVWMSIYTFITFSLFFRPESTLRAIIPGILWMLPFFIGVQKVSQNHPEKLLRQYHRSVYVSALILAVWTFFTIST